MIVSVGAVRVVRNKPPNRISSPFFNKRYGNFSGGGGVNLKREAHKTGQMGGSSNFIEKDYDFYRLERS